MAGTKGSPRSHAKSPCKITIVDHCRHHRRRRSALEREVSAPQTRLLWHGISVVAGCQTLDTTPVILFRQLSMSELQAHAKIGVDPSPAQANNPPVTPVCAASPPFPKPTLPQPAHHSARCPASEKDAYSSQDACPRSRRQSLPSIHAIPAGHA